MTTVSIPSVRQPRSAVAGRAAWDSLYAITALPLGLVGFVVTVVGISAGVGTLIVWVGLPILAATLVVSSWLARLERLRLVAMQGREPRPASYRVAGTKRGPIVRLLDPLRDPQMWLDALWGPLAFVTGLLAFVVTVVWWAVALAGTTYWIWQGWLPGTQDTVASQIGLGEGRAAESLFNLALGLIACATLPWAVRCVAWLHASLADVVLNGRSSLSARVERAEGARDAAQAAEAVSLRRLERDIHDGPQQRLVRLTMDLGRARRQMDADPEQASATIESALEQARGTLDELRSLSRGIAPPLLVDRGLGVALDELVVRGAVTVDLVHELPTGLSPHVETAVYFTVSEALTNVAKHSGAGAAQVRVVPAGTDLLVEIRDHGVGGAHLGKGQGLAGLAQRVAAVDGTLEVDSPDGGPTVVTARIPVG